MAKASVERPEGIDHLAGEVARLAGELAAAIERRKAARAEELSICHALSEATGRLNKAHDELFERVGV